MLITKRVENTDDCVLYDDNICYGRFSGPQYISFCIKIQQTLSKRDSFNKEVYDDYDALCLYEKLEAKSFENKLYENYTDELTFYRNKLHKHCIDYHNLYAKTQKYFNFKSHKIKSMLDECVSKGLTELDKECELLTRTYKLTLLLDMLF
ncbi:MAG: hypothetical protein AABY22_30505 [Nanoarchaeota archaeon]